MNLNPFLVVAILLIPACARAPIPPPTAEQVAILMGEQPLCKKIAAGTATTIEKEAFSKRKIDCGRYKASKYKEKPADPKSLDDELVCRGVYEHGLTNLSKEAQRRGLDCYEILSVYYQRERLWELKNAHRKLEERLDCLSNRYCRGY